MIVCTQFLDLRMLDAITAAAWMTQVHLFKNDHIPTVTDILADYVEADYQGYGSLAIAWAPPFIDGDGKAQVLGTPCVFLKLAGGVSNTVFGVYVTEIGGTNVSYALRFTSPRPMIGAGDSTIYNPVFTCVSE
jgi:hypothetical protein